MLNRVHILRKIQIRGSVVSSLPCLAEIAFLCFSSFDGEGGNALSNLTVPPRRVQKATKGSFEFDPFSLKNDRVAEGKRFFEYDHFWLKEW